MFAETQALTDCFVAGARSQSVCPECVSKVHAPSACRFRPIRNTTALEPPGAPQAWSRICPFVFVLTPRLAQVVLQLVAPDQGGVLGPGEVFALIGCGGRSLARCGRGMFEGLTADAISD